MYLVRVLGMHLILHGFPNLAKSYLIQIAVRQYKR